MSDLFERTEKFEEEYLNIPETYIQFSLDGLQSEPYYLRTDSSHTSKKTLKIPVSSCQGNLLQEKFKPVRPLGSTATIDIVTIYEVNQELL